MIFVRIIDNQGLFVEDAFVDELTEFTIDIPCPSGFYHPKWDGEKWIEGGEVPPPVTPEPTLEEQIAELKAAIEALINGSTGGMA